jgi:hypothetical protein
MKTNLENNSETIGTENSPKSSRGRKSCLPNGCLVIVVIILAPYILNAIYILGGSFINQAKWQRRGSSSYTVTVNMTALSPLMGSNTITVIDGKVIAVKSSWTDANSYLQSFDEITIERMFSDAKGCALYFPLLWCSFEYDTFYGYPKKVMIDCPMPDACFTRLWVDDLELINP